MAAGSCRLPSCRRARRHGHAACRLPLSLSSTMIQITVDYLGDLRCHVTHGPSQNTVITDAPVDNHGKGESFSPTDLVATALGTCVATVMGIFAQRHEIDLRGMKVTVSKEMTQA